MMLGEKLDKYFDFITAYEDLKTQFGCLNSSVNTPEEELFKSFLNLNTHNGLTLDLNECYIDLPNKRVTFFLSDIEELGLEDVQTVCIGYNYVDEEIDVFEED